MTRRGFRRTEKVEPPHGRVRPSQMMTAYGPGSLVDLLDQAVLIGGLDFWAYLPGRGHVIEEPRLRDVLAQRFENTGHDLAFTGAFREPPPGNDDEPTRACGVHVLEFPQWFVCQSCRALLHMRVLERKAERYWHDCKPKAECVPVRFVGACRRGHIQDYPWIAFVHSGGEERCAAPSLVLREGATGDFSEIDVACTSCSLRRKLSEAMVDDIAPRCRGERPWLGREGKEECTEPMRLLVRTASNAYFSQVVSALSIPDKSRELEDAVRDVWDTLQAATPELLPAFRNIPAVRAAVGAYTDTEVLAAIEGIRRGAPAAREPLRTAEFKQLVSARDEVPGDLPRAGDAFFARRGRIPALPEGIASVVLCHKLREVRVQIGFTRIEPATPDLQGEYDLGVELAALGLTTEWLPATEVRGEGVFIRLDEDTVRAWEARSTVLARGEALHEGWKRWRETLDRSRAPRGQARFPGVRFYLLHSLSHLLVTAIAEECGYASSAIRERIYCAPSDDPTPMAALLLSTGSPGTEGTLGGLVGQGRRIRHHLRAAFDLGRLCSNDPVCAGHNPSKDPTERFLEGAACHGCLFVAEPSCERFNRFLDRALVVPTLGHDPDLAFFQERP